MQGNRLPARSSILRTVMTRIVTTHYRYKRPPGKRKSVALECRR
jgi:hypothetical protein